MDIKTFRLKGNFTFLRQSTEKPLLTVKGLKILVKLSYVFSFVKTESKLLRAIWFADIRCGYKEEEMAMFVDMLHRSLRHNAAKFTLKPGLCVAIDVSTGFIINYGDVDGTNLSQLIPKTLDEIYSYRSRHTIL